MQITPDIIPTIILSDQARKDIDIVIALSDKEIAMSLEVTKHDNTYIITNCYMPKQQVTGVTIEYDRDAQIALLDEIPNQDLLRGAWHSHVNMPVSPSGTDIEQFNDFIEMIDDHFIYLISNKKGDFFCKFKDITNGITYYDIPISDGYSKKDIDKWKSEIELKVSEKKYTTKTYPVKRYGHNIQNHTKAVPSRIEDYMDQLNDTPDCGDMEFCDTCGRQLTITEMKSATVDRDGYIKCTECQEGEDVDSMHPRLVKCVSCFDMFYFDEVTWGPGEGFLCVKCSEMSEKYKAAEEIKNAESSENVEQTNKTGVDNE